jgi:hypothetical protein
MSQITQACRTPLATRWYVFVLACLGVLLMLTLALVQDATHPYQQTDACLVEAIGPAVTPLKPSHRLLYRNGSNPLHDVALNCKQQGLVWLNEPSPLGQISTNPGQRAVVKQKHFRWLPNQIYVGVHTKVKKPLQ